MDTLHTLSSVPEEQGHCIPEQPDKRPTGCHGRNPPPQSSSTPTQHEPLDATNTTPNTRCHRKPNPRRIAIACHQVKGLERCPHAACHAQRVHDKPATIEKRGFPHDTYYEGNDSPGKEALREQAQQLKETGTA